VPGESAERPEGESNEQSVEVLTCTDQRDEYSSSESGDSESEEDCVDDTSGFNMVMPTRAGRQTAHQMSERFSSVQVKVCGVYPNDVSPHF